MELSVDGLTPGATSAWLRRAAILSLALASTAGACAMAAALLIDVGSGVLDWLVLSLFTVNFAWIVTSFWVAVIGFLMKLSQQGGASRGLSAPPTPLGGRHAVIMPIYNEDTGRVFAGLEATWRSLQSTEQGRAFDLFILSDTTDEAIAHAERGATQTLTLRLGGDGRIFYRRRATNVGRKAGNIAEFCQRWGDGYVSMTVLDADSVMSGETIIALAAEIERQADVGIIQTLPMPANRSTLFARMLQFSAALYGPVQATGAAFWQLGEANYWGHNAIIRIAAFRAHCDLSGLARTGLFGGEILSHDFVEAALMRGAGWRIFLVPDLSGSFEEVPANLIDFAQRDRRWIQGNLQHLRLLATPGFHPVSRVHLLMGIMSYLASPLWLAFLICGSASAMIAAAEGPSYFSAGPSLFPIWPISRFTENLILLGVTGVVILGPKLLGLALALSRAESRSRFGGAGALILSAGLELLFSAVLAPCMMALHSYFIASALIGKTVKWDAQPRDDRGLSLSEAIDRLGPVMALGVIWSILLAGWAPDYLWWLAPVLLAMVAAVPFAMVGGRRDVGEALRRSEILFSPLERAPPIELAMTQRLQSEAPRPEHRAATIAAAAS